MPKALERFLGYLIYFWSEPGEPIHVHICKGKPRKSDTKVWITENGAELAHNKSDIPKHELKQLLRYISANKDRIVANWVFRYKSGEVKR